MKNTFEFAADCITVNGKSFPARYEVTAEAVNVFATVTEDGKEKTVCIRIDAIDPLYGPASIAAAQPAEQEPQPEAEQAEEAQAEPEAQQTEEAQQAEEAQAEPEAQQTEEAQQAEEAQAEEAQAEPETQQAAEEAEQTAEEAEQTAPEAEQTAQEAEQTAPEAEQTEEAQAESDPKAARGPVPEKSFIGQSISGAGWSIVFDGGCNRTRVLVCKAQRDKLRGIIEKAGFYYSPTLDSWNKKLTFRAYRAAQALALELSEALAA